MFKVTKQLRKIAKKVMDNALPIQRGEVAVFYAGVENLDLAYAFATECELRGIETLVQSCGDYINHTKLLEAPIQVFERLPKLPPKLIEAADWFIHMTGTSFDNSINQKPELRERLLEVRRKSKWQMDKLLQMCIKQHKHFVAFLDPNLQQAQALGKSYRETRDMFLKSLDIDYDAVTQLGKRIISVMERGGEIRLTCPRGSDLTLRADGRVWDNDDGKLEGESDSASRYVHNLPIGEVFVAPIEDSAYGVVYPRNSPGSVLEGVRVEFRGKQKAVFSAEKGFEFVEARLKNATGNPLCIAEFAFGTNPCGDILLATEKAFGTCHFAIGQNTWLGGKNECSIHWDFLIDNPTVTVDGKLVLKNRKFKI